MLKKLFSYPSLKVQHDLLGVNKDGSKDGNKDGDQDAINRVSTLNKTVETRLIASLLMCWFVFGAILRFIHLDAKPPWTDEFSTLVFSLGNSFLNVPLDQPISVDTLLQPLQPRPGAGVQDVLKHLFTESNHPPIYFILTHLWLRLFPTDGGLVSVWGARSLAAILGAVSVPAIYALSWRLYRSRTVSNLAAAFMATSPYAIFLAQEARHYSIAILWVIASLGCFVSATRHIRNGTKLPIKIALTWIVVNALGIATHYFFVLTLCCQALVLLFLLVKQLRNKQWGAVWYRIFAVATGTAISGAVWIPVFLQNSYGGKLTEWIQGDKVGFAWLNPIFQTFAAWITMISLLPIESPHIYIVIASGLVMLAFFIWATPVLVRGLKARLVDDEQFITKLLIGFIISGLVIFFVFTYFFGIDLTRGARYNFVYFPAVIILVGASLAVCWQAPTVKMFKWRISGQKAVLVIWLMSLASGITVVNNLGYQKYYRPDLFINLIRETSSKPVLIATTQKTHVHIGEMMGVGKEMKKSQKLLDSKFLLAHQDNNPETSTKALGKAVKTLPRPFDLWKVNFFADDPEELETCSLNSNPLPPINGYEYKLYRCR